ncbi:MAG: Wzz/FepE/Etk N-terminal domain-containing protein [Anaerolineales bacterium]|nr:Wzz/FepE/Etk N-terminal domain-containing protein [Anaerolineales bacterium]
MLNQSDWRAYLDVLIRRWYIVVAMPLLAMLAAALATFALKPTYEATATIALAPATVSISLANQLPPYYLVVSDPRRLPIAYTPTYYIAILKGADVVSAAKPQVAVTIAPDGNDRSLIHLTARGDDPKQVADAANAYAHSGIARLQQLIQPTGAEATAARQHLDDAENALSAFARDNNFSYDPTAPDVPSNLPRPKILEFQQLLRERDIAESVYLDFARERERMAILATTAYRPTLIAAPVPAVPIAPKLAPNVLIGAAFGLLIGLLGAFLLELFARR